MEKVGKGHYITIRSVLKIQKDSGAVDKYETE